MEVGVRELKNSLSRYLRRVKDGGETIVVTERGEPVARIIPVGVPHMVAKLLAEGRITWSGNAFRPPPRLLTPRPGRPLSDYVSEDRV